MRRILAGLALALLVVVPVQAGPDPFTYEQVGWRDSPPYTLCYEEDDGAEWAGYGRIDPGFRLDQTLTFCETVGGSAFWFLLVAHTEFAVTITSPSGLSWPLTFVRDRGDWITTACVGDDHGVLDLRERRRKPCPLCGDTRRMIAVGFEAGVPYASDKMG